MTIITDKIVQLLGDMYEAVLAHDETGLAAPQISKNLRMAVIKINEGSSHFELISPMIIEKKGASIDVEGYLGIPETYGTIERADEMTARYFDHEGEEMEVTACDYLARTFRHEIDHLSGELSIDKMIGRVAPKDLEAYMEKHFDG